MLTSIWRHFQDSGPLFRSKIRQDLGKFLDNTGWKSPPGPNSAISEYFFEVSKLRILHFSKEFHRRYSRRSILTRFGNILVFKSATFRRQFFFEVNVKIEARKALFSSVRCCRLWNEMKTLYLLENLRTASVFFLHSSRDIAWLGGVGRR